MTREAEIMQTASEWLRYNHPTCTQDMLVEAFSCGAECADRNQPHPWISVEDRMPEITYQSSSESKFVFVHVVNKDTGSEWIELSAKYNERFHDWQANDFTWIGKRSGVVTHWMPIPTIPKNN